MIGGKWPYCCYFVGHCFQEAGIETVPGWPCIQLVIIYIFGIIKKCCHHHQGVMTARIPLTLFNEFVLNYPAVPNMSCSSYLDGL